MASFLTELTKPYVEKLINGAIAESSYICCFTCIAKDFEEEKARLEVERKTVKQRVDVATRRGEDVQGNALFWEEEAEKLIQEDTRTTQKCFFGFCSHCIWRYRRGKELANKKEHIKKLMETGKELAIGLPARLPDVERYSSQHYIPFKSRESKYKELLDALKDDSNYIIGLKGMGGTGKTTLAKEVGKELKQSKQFTHVIDTTVSCSPDTKKIQDDIAGPLGLKWDDCSESDRAKKIWSRLTNGEKILLILDDVWGDIDFDEIGIPYSDNHKGCRVLVTTRKMLVCNKMGCSKIIQLKLLSKDDAWIMFKRYAGLSDISTKSLLDKALKISNECKKLPVAISAIASSLKGEQRLEEWDVALKSLQKHVSMHGVDDEIIKIYKCLKFSYDNMKDEKAKRIFLLCSVFQEDEKIPTEMLTRLGIGAGLFGEDYENYEDARSQVFTSKNKLLDSCLLLEADLSRVKMHDLVRDAAQWLANKEIQTVKLYDKNQKALVEREKNIKYLLLEGKLKDVFSCKLDGSKLEVLIVIVHKDEDCHDVKFEVPNSFFENNICLRVFHFSNHYPMLSPSLPQSIQSLKNIRSLLFTQVNLGDISMLGNLQSLETLDLECCIINELPHGFTKLEKFRLLKLRGCIIARNNPFEVIERCSSLEELYFTGSFNDFCREITFPKLQRFCIDECFTWPNDSSSNYVSIEYQDEIFLSETTLRNCMQDTKVLKIRRLDGGWTNLIPEIVPIDQGLNDLVELGLSCTSQLQFLIDTMHTDSHVPNVFSKLVVLNLYGLENLEELCNGPLSFDSLNSLEELSIENCKNLRSLFKCNLNLCNLKKVLLEECPRLIILFQQSTARSLVFLERLEIIDCGCLEYIIVDERKGDESRGEIVDDDDDDDNDSMSRGSMFLKLEVLTIKKCPGLELILPFTSAHDLPALKSITMESCDKLKYIFGQTVELGSLKQMNLDDLPNLIDIFPKCNPTMSSIKRSSSISRYASKSPTQSDPIKRSIFSWTNIYCCGKKYGHKLKSATSTKTTLIFEDQPHENLIAMESNSYPHNIWERTQYLSIQSHILCNLNKIILCNISKIKSVFILSIAPRMLLETLIIRKCDELKHIVIETGVHDNGSINLGNVFPKLKALIVENCVQLEYMFGLHTADHQNHTKNHLHLPALESLYLCDLPSFVAMCPKQYHTTFPPLKYLALKECSTIANMKSIGDFITHHSVTRSVDGTVMKELGGSIKHFLGLECLVVCNSKVENICFLNEENGQHMNFGLLDIDLCDLPMLKSLFVGPNNSFSLKNLTRINILRCEQLEIVFSTSILRCLPQLRNLRIEECKELKHMVEDDLENKKSSNTKTCFPKLKTLAVVKCNKLKYVFPISIYKELPELKVILIREAEELEEIFVSEGDDQKMEIPNLKIVVFINLPSLCQTQEIQFKAVEYRVVQNCQKLSLTSTLTPNRNELYSLDPDNDTINDLLILFEQLQKESKGHDTSNENPSSKTNEDFAAAIEVQATSKHESTSSQGIKISVEEGTTSTNSKTITSTTHLELASSSSGPLITSDCRTSSQGIKINVEEGTISTNAKTISSSTHLELVGSSGPIVTSECKTSSQEDGDGQIATTFFSIATTKTNDQASLNDDVAMKVSSIVQQQFPKEDEIIVSKSRPSFASQFPSKPSEEDPTKKVEDLSSSLLVTRELEQLVSNNHLGYENLSLLTDFLVNHPSVSLKDTSLSNRYKGCAYNLLADLLKFLKTHSVLEVLGSCQTEFVELLQDARSFAFDKDWLDGIERRTLFPEIQVSQDAFQKLLDSKKQVTKDVEVLRLKIDILNQHVEDLKHQLISSETLLESIIQQEAALSAPIGY